MSISCRDLVESYKGFKVKAVTKDENECITVWNINDITYGKNSWGLLSCNSRAFLFSELGLLEITEFIGKEAKDCIYVVEEPVDYEKWKNCLVWFWNNEKCPICPPVARFKEERYGKFIVQYEGDNIQVNHCRPVRRDEVQFVED